LAVLLIKPPPSSPQAHRPSSTYQSSVSLQTLPLSNPDRTLLDSSRPSTPVASAPQAFALCGPIITIAASVQFGHHDLDHAQRSRLLRHPRGIDGTVRCKIFYNVDARRPSAHAAISLDRALVVFPSQSNRCRFQLQRACIIWKIRCRRTLSPTKCSRRATGGPASFLVCFLASHHYALWLFSPFYSPLFEFGELKLPVILRAALRQRWHLCENVFSSALRCTKTDGGTYPLGTVNANATRYHACRAAGKSAAYIDLSLSIQGFSSCTSLCFFGSHGHCQSLMR